MRRDAFRFDEGATANGGGMTIRGLGRMGTRTIIDRERKRSASRMRITVRINGNGIVVVCVHRQVILAGRSAIVER